MINIHMHSNTQKKSKNIQFFNYLYHHTNNLLWLNNIK